MTKTLDILTDNTDALLETCEKLHSMMWLFSEHYTLDCADNTINMIARNPEAFAVLTHTITDLVEEVTVNAQKVANSVYNR